ncbi:hypothetical protein Pmani_038332, partial [Petrolisthes manimaculis]
NFTCLEVEFTFKRRLGYYLFHTYIPTCLIVIMSWISFWIKPEARTSEGDVRCYFTAHTLHTTRQLTEIPAPCVLYQVYPDVPLFIPSCSLQLLNFLPSCASPFPYIPFNSPPSLLLYLPPSCDPDALPLFRSQWIC